MTLAEKFELVTAVDEYVFGFCLAERANIGVGESGDTVDYITGLLETGEFPMLSGGRRRARCHRRVRHPAPPARRPAALQSQPRPPPGRLRGRHAEALTVTAALIDRRTVAAMRVVAAMDKFRGTATAAEAAAAVGHAGWELGLDVDEVPMSDGGEGLLDVLGGPNRTSVVTGPLGAPVEAAWRIAHRTAVIEMARASGLSLAGGAEGNDPLPHRPPGRGSSSTGRSSEGARRVIVGLGGSATTDGGLGAVEALAAARRGSAASSWRSRATSAPASSTPPPCSPRRRAPPRPRSPCSRPA